MYKFCIVVRITVLSHVYKIRIPVLHQQRSFPLIMWCGMQNYIKDKSLFGVLQCCYIKQSAYNRAFCFLTQSSRFSPKQYIIYSLLLYILIAKTSLKYYFLPVYLLNITTSNQYIAYNELERNPSEMVVPVSSLLV